MKFKAMKLVKFLFVYVMHVSLLILKGSCWRVILPPQGIIQLPKWLVHW